jgi:hypothetical protein
MDVQDNYLFFFSMFIILMLMFMAYSLGGIKEKQRAGFALLGEISGVVKTLAETVAKLAADTEIRDLRHNEKINILSKELDMVESKINRLSK